MRVVAKLSKVFKIILLAVFVFLIIIIGLMIREEMSLPVILLPIIAVIAFLIVIRINVINKQKEKRINDIKKLFEE
ncbi:MAG: hypothetical protein IKQ61_13380 [Spirochaetales bacterium]|nr:hypothetical protein [Spirochaetales bacterium]